MTAHRLGDSMKLPTRQPMCVWLRPLYSVYYRNYTKQKWRHSHPPNHTGDHGHLKRQAGRCRVQHPSVSSLHRRERTQNTEDVAKSATLSPGTANLLLHTVTASPAANQLLKKEGTTPRPRLLSTQNSLATCLNTVPGPKSARVYLR
ncbi:hypothetical protein E2C01_098461 [Portunus trituberculatus]|uniref:Uncharacterized protein n=1 Tax=Portunus trituberculatus TaxID=210409 RepID=A0A5B7KE94_PORTR|nr:hypothetical protein [Portunus trituberculatus]